MWFCCERDRDAQEEEEYTVLDAKMRLNEAIVVMLVLLTLLRRALIGYSTPRVSVQPKQRDNWFFAQCSASYHRSMRNPFKVSG